MVRKFYTYLNYSLETIYRKIYKVVNKYSVKGEYTKMMNKRGQAGAAMNKLMGAVLVVVLATALAPTMFTSIFGLNDSEIPTWLKVTLQTVVGFGIVFLVWRTLGAGGK